MSNDEFMNLTEMKNDIFGINPWVFWGGILLCIIVAIYPHLKDLWLKHFAKKLLKHIIKDMSDKDNLGGFYDK